MPYFSTQVQFIERAGMTTGGALPGNDVANFSSSGWDRLSVQYEIQPSRLRSKMALFILNRLMLRNSYQK